jgi:UDP-N-acetylglucosamine transferase subunit ALG13
MIFVTVGAQMPFDRLVMAVDEWAGRRGRDDVLAQTGESHIAPRNIRSVRHLAPPQFDRAVRECSAVVAHAGTGSIFSALRAGKPILVMPRRAALRETRNDHQLGTARQLCPRLGVPVAMDEHELQGRLDELERLAAAGAAPIGRYAPEPLTSGLHGFIVSARPARGGILGAAARWPRHA